MELEQLQRLYSDNLAKIFTHSGFKKIADHSNNIQGYSFINRALIYFQNENASDVRSYEGWEASGKIVDANTNGISILGVIQDIHYIDTESDEEVILSELTPIELRKAIELGLVTKTIDIAGLKCEIVYDISDTKDINTQVLTCRQSRSFKLSSLFKLAQSIDISVEKVDDSNTTYDKDLNTIKIGSDSIENKIKVIMYALIEKLIYSIVDASDLEKNDLELVLIYSYYSVCSYYGLESSMIEYEIDNMNLNVDEDKQENVIAYMDVAEQFIQDYIINGNNQGTIINTSQISNDKAKRASMLLSILESNYQAKGGELS